MSAVVVSGWVRRASWWRLAVLLSLLVLATGILPPPTQINAEGPSLVWSALGPGGSKAIAQIAVSPRWPADPFIYIVRYETSEGSGPARGVDAARSYDGGHTWELLPEPPSARLEITITRGSDGQRLLFGNDSYYNTLYGAYRSTDDGRTWEKLPSAYDDRHAAIAVLSPSFQTDNAVLVNPGHDIQPKPGRSSLSLDAGQTWQSLAPAGDRPVDTVHFSPDFANDQTLFAVIDDQIVRSTDRGSTWRSATPAPDQLLVGPVFSPDYAQDRTIFLVATWGQPPSGTRPANRPSASPLPDEATFAEVSAGVLVSTDAGETWASLADGLNVDGAPHRLVEWVQPSPAYATDGTLFAYAWGPGKGVANRPAALFRSRDRGATWDVLQKDPARTNYLSFGPRFGETSIAVRESVNRHIISPGSNSCRATITRDGGTTWASPGVFAGYGGCGFIEFLDERGETILMLTSSQGSTSWYLTRDAGATLATGFQRPPGWVDNERPGMARAIRTPDGLLLFGSRGSVWALGPNERPTHGRLPCSTPEEETNLQAIGSSTTAWAGLGCPTGPAQTVNLRMREEGPAYSTDTYKTHVWIEDDSQSWWTLGSRTPDAPLGTATAWLKSASPWTDPGTLIAGARVQPYDGGIVLTLPESEAGAQTYLIGRAGWERIPR